MFLKKANIDLKETNNKKHNKQTIFLRSKASKFDETKLQKATHGFVSSLRLLLFPAISSPSSGLSLACPGMSNCSMLNGALFSWAESFSFPSCHTSLVERFLLFLFKKFSLNCGPKRFKKKMLIRMDWGGRSRVQ